MGWLAVVSLAVLMLVFTGCGGDSTSTPSVTAAPAKPTGITASGGDSQVAVSWSAVADATSYNIYYGATAGVTTTTGTKVASATSPQAVTGLTNGIPYYFVVTAVNAGGESIVSSEKSATPAAAPQLPAKPAGIAVSGGDSQVTVSWSAVTDATSYNIYYGTTADVSTASDTQIVGVTSSHVITGLTNGTAYYVVVTAVNAVGESVVSSEKSATPAATPQPPASPNGRNVSSTVAGQLSATWNAVTGAVSYNIYYLQANTVPAKAEVLASLPATSTTASTDITGLTSGATYYVLITAVNAAGESGTQTNAQAVTIL